MLKTTALFTLDRNRRIAPEYRTWYERVNGRRVWVDDSLGLSQGGLIAMHPEAEASERHYAYTEELSDFEHAE